MAWHAQECAQGGPLTSFVSERWASPQPNGLVLSEAEARYLFRVRAESCSLSNVCYRRNTDIATLCAAPIT